VHSSSVGREYKIRGRQAHEGHFCKAGTPWDTPIKPVKDDMGDTIGSEFTRKHCIYCMEERQVRYNPDGSLTCIDCGTVYNQGKPFPEKKARTPEEAKHWNMERFMTRYYQPGN
jgi:ribosomal protein S27E